MKKLLLLLLCVPLIGLGQETGCISGDCENGYGEFILGEEVDCSGYVRYFGNFKDGLYDGYGYLTEHHECVHFTYSGYFKEGKRNGIGREFHEEVGGSLLFVGEWENDKPKFGTELHESVHGSWLYYGSFSGYYYHGQGKMTYEDGTIEEGLWENGKFIGE